MPSTLSSLNFFLVIAVFACFCSSDSRKLAEKSLRLVIEDYVNDDNQSVSL